MSVTIIGEENLQYLVRLITEVREYMFTTEEMQYEKPEKYNFSQSLFEKIKLSSAKNIVDEIDSIDSDEARETLKVILDKQPDSILNQFDLLRADTNGIHDVTYGQQPLGDFYFSDLISSIYNIDSGSSILDFGCSTGRVIRNLRSVFDFDAYGCDPREDSIEFNKKNFQNVKWFKSNEVPPLLSELEYNFDMAFAISVWSHFSEEMALCWFNEFHKRLNSNGRLIFTTHGTRSIYHFHNILKKMPDAKAEERLSILRGGGIHFMPYPSGNNDLSSSHWGMTFMSKKWLQTTLKDKWAIKDYRPGIAMRNQDLYVLEKI